VRELDKFLEIATKGQVTSTAGEHMRKVFNIANDDNNWMFHYSPKWRHTWNMIELLHAMMYISE
jgi:hypothetical protein